MATHQDNRPVIGGPPLVSPRGSRRARSIRISLGRYLSDNYRLSLPKLLTLSGVVDNDIVSFANKDDVLTYLIHLGYLGFDQTSQMAFVPNEEIRQELIEATESQKWNEFLLFQQESQKLLDATLDMDEQMVAKEIEKLHEEYTSDI